MGVAMLEKYQARTFDNLSSLDGISAKQMEVHMKLYAGYVNGTNAVTEKVAQMIEKGEVGTPEYQELKRRWGFEFDGMRIHEYYFEALKGGAPALSSSSPLYKKIEEQFGSYANWELDFKKTGAMRGIGWAILYQDPMTGRLFNFWVSDHELGHPAGFNVILAMDVWEHAYTVDWTATDRPTYIDAYMKNIDWSVVEPRLK